MTDAQDTLEQLDRMLPLLEDLETGQDCEDYAFAKGRGFQAMTYCPDAFEALRHIPAIRDRIAMLEADNAALREEGQEALRRIEQLKAAVRHLQQRPARMSETPEWSDPTFDNEKEAMKLLALIVAEFETDPMSVQCFDLRVVERAKKCIKERESYERRGLVAPLLTEGQP